MAVVLTEAVLTSLFRVRTQFSDKDMRVIMKQNNLLINDYNPNTGVPGAI